jgi:hypothetical protein
MEAHYDPAYDRVIRKDEHRLLGELELPGLDETAQDAAAGEIAGLIRGRSPPSRRVG